jgi:hypothetical protein
MGKFSVRHILMGSVSTGGNTWVSYWINTDSAIHKMSRCKGDWHWGPKITKNSYLQQQICHAVREMILRRHLNAEAVVLIPVRTYGICFGQIETGIGYLQVGYFYILLLVSINQQPVFKFY